MTPTTTHIRMALNRMTLIRITLIIAQSTMALNRMSLGRMTLSKMTLNKMPLYAGGLSLYYSYRNNTKHNVTQQNATLQNATQLSMPLKYDIRMTINIMPFYIIKLGLSYRWTRVFIPFLHSA
jgi:hypothetical protein